MAQYIEVIGVGQVEFPDGMSKDEMAAALSKLPRPETPVAEAATTPAAPTEDLSKPAFLSPKPFRKDQALRTRAEEVKKEEAAKLPFNQLYEDEKNFNTIFEYAKARFGKEGVPIAGETKEDYVKRFASHMRMLDMGNEISGVQELQYLNNAKRDDVIKAGAAYDLFKNTAGYFDAKGGQGGFRPVIDAIGAIASSPTTAFSLGTGKVATGYLTKAVAEKGARAAVCQHEALLLLLLFLLLKAQVLLFLTSINRRLTWMLQQHSLLKQMKSCQHLTKRVKPSCVRQ